MSLTDQDKGVIKELRTELDLRMRGYIVTVNRNSYPHDITAIDPDEPRLAIRVEVRTSCRNPRTGRLWHDVKGWMSPEALAKRDVLAIVESDGRITYEPPLLRPLETFATHALGCHCQPREPRRRRTSL